MATLVNDRLLASVSALMLNAVLNGGLGFVFWTLAARVGSVGDVGLVTTTVSGAALIGTLGGLGLPNALVAIVGRHPRSRSVLITAAGLTVISVGLVLVLSWWTPLRPPIAREDRTAVALAVVFVVGGAVSTLVDGLLVAVRMPGRIVVKNAAAGVLRILLLLAFMATRPAVDTAVALMAIQDAGLVVAGVVAAWWLYRHGLTGRPGVDVFLLRPVLSLSVANALGTAVGILPTALTPILVLHLTGVRGAGLFGVCMMLVTLTNVAASAVAQSLFAESAYTDDVAGLVRRGGRGLALILVPGVVVGVLVAPLILAAFGRTYTTEADTCLRWMLLGAIPAAVSYLTDALANARRDGRGYFFLNAQNAVVVVALVTVAATHSLGAVGFAWFMAQLVSAVVSLAYTWAREHRRGVRPAVAMKEGVK